MDAIQLGEIRKRSMAKASNAAIEWMDAHSDYIHGRGVWEPQYSINTEEFEVGDLIYAVYRRQIIRAIISNAEEAITNDEIMTWGKVTRYEFYEIPSTCFTDNSIEAFKASVLAGKVGSPWTSSHECLFSNLYDAVVLVQELLLHSLCLDYDGVMEKLREWC